MMLRHMKVFWQMTAPILKFIENFNNNLHHLNLLFHFDNLFISISLPVLLQLTGRNYGGADTIRESKLTNAMKELFL